MADRELLVGDIGGTNARFAVTQPGGNLRDIKVMKVADYDNFDRALAAYLDELPGTRPTTLCIASAGARQGDMITLTNAPWSLGEEALGTMFGFAVVRLINDFQAQARYAGTMPETGGELLKAGTPRRRRAGPDGWAGDRLRPVAVRAGLSAACDRLRRRAPPAARAK